MARKNISRSKLNQKKGRIHIVNKAWRLRLSEKRSQLIFVDNQLRNTKQELLYHYRAGTKQVHNPKEYHKRQARYCADNIQVLEREKKDLESSITYIENWICRAETQECCPLPDLAKEVQYQNKAKILASRKK